MVNPAEKEAGDAPPALNGGEVPGGAGRVPAHRKSVPLYIGAGGIATACHYAFIAIAVEFFGAWPLAATVGGFALGSAVKYWLNYFVAFRSAEPHPSALARFAVFLLVMLAMNTAWFAVLHQWAGLHYMIAQALTTILLIPPGYLLSRRWVFVRC